MGFGTAGELRRYAFSRIEQAKRQANQATEEALRRNPSEVERLTIKEFDFREVVIRHDRIRQSAVSAVGTRQKITVEILMSGDVELLEYRATRSRDERRPVRIEQDRVAVDIIEAQIMRSHIDEVKAIVSEHVEWLNKDLAVYRQVLRDAIANATTAASAQAHARHSTEEMLGVTVAANARTQAAQDFKKVLRSLGGRARRAFRAALSHEFYQARQGTLALISVILALISVIVAIIAIRLSRP